MSKKANPEGIKWPTNKTRYDENYLKIFGVKCSACKGKGYFDDYCKLQKKHIKTTCLLCNGIGRVKK